MNMNDLISGQLVLNGTFETDCVHPALAYSTIGLLQLHHKSTI